jgi:transmembrane sensor
VLYEGHVAVLEDQKGGEPLKPVKIGATHVAAETALTPGHELVTRLAPVRSGSADAVTPIRLDEVDRVRSRSWEAGQLVFDDEPLSTAVERVNRYSNRKIVVGDAAAAEARISGTFDAGDSSAFIDGVTAVLPVKAMQTSRGVTLVGKARS